MVWHKYSPQVLEASSYLSLSSLFVLSFCLFVCVLLFLRCSKDANYSDFVISIQCIVCMPYNVYCFLLPPFFFGFYCVFVLFGFYCVAAEK